MAVGAMQKLNHDVSTKPGTLFMLLLAPRILEPARKKPDGSCGILRLHLMLAAVLPDVARLSKI
jgi:hypothetical protein